MNDTRQQVQQKVRIQIVAMIGGKNHGSGQRDVVQSFDGQESTLPEQRRDDDPSSEMVCRRLVSVPAESRVGQHRALAVAGGARPAER